MGNPIGIWNLEADPTALEVLAEAWNSQIRQLSWAADTINGAAFRVIGADSWAGETAERYDQHRRKLVPDLDDCAELADKVVRALGECAHVLRHNQEQLTAEYQKLQKLQTDYESDSPPGQIDLRPPFLMSSEHQKAVQVAEQIRSRVDQELNVRLGVLNAALGQLRGWERVWGARTLRMLNWNIQQGGGGNDFFDRDAGTDPGDFGQLAQRIIAGKVDVATLQEVFQGGADELRRELNAQDPAGKWEVHFGEASDKYQWSDPGAPPIVGSKDGFGNAVVVRTGSGVTSGPIKVHDLGKGEEERGAIEVPINLG